jgi:hypothetical protein
VAILILSTTTGAVNDPTNIRINCGSNNLAVSGFNASGNPVTQTASFTLNCAAPAVSGGLAFTGWNFLRWVLVAAIILVIGGGLILFTRRRKVNPQT